MLIVAPAAAQTKIKIVATFSILGDLVKNVGGERIEVSTLVGPNSDAHVYSPTPADAKRLHEAQIVVVNGLGLEGWLTRLVKASGTKAATVVASAGITPRRMEDEHQPGHMVTDPHAWQSVGNAKVYVGNIRDGLIKADPAGKSEYETNALNYLAKLDALEKDVKEAIGKISADRRRVITAHSALGYFGAAYGMEFISPEGVSTDSEASAKDVAKHHRTDQEAENSGRVHGKHLRSAAHAANRQGNRRQDRRHVVFRRAVGAERSGRQLHRHDAQ